MSREDWLEARRKGIGGSDIAAIMGLHPYKSRYDVYASKLGIEDDDSEDNFLMKFGRDVEPLIGKWFSEDTGLEVRRETKMGQHPDFDFVLGNVDFMIEESEQFEGQGILECKSTSYWVLKNIDEEIPMYWYLQNQWYQMIFGTNFGYVSYLYDRNLEHKLYEANAEIQEKMLEAAYDFWHNHVLAEEPPKSLKKEVVDKIYSDVVKKDYKEVDDETYALVESNALRLNEIKSEIKELEAEKEELESEIKYEIGDHYGIAHAGEEIAKWIEVSCSKTDPKKVEEEYPGVSEKCQKQIKYRRLYY